MSTLRLIPVARNHVGQARQDAELVELAGEQTVFGLREVAAGKLAVDVLESGTTQDPAHIAVLRRETHGEYESWFLLRRDARLGINGMHPTLPLMVLEPGALLSLDGHFWMASLLWIPTPAPAPEHLAEKKCPVCGGELKLAPVVKCLCGRWVHLEKPEVPDDTEALNCFFEGGRCGSCGHTATLTPQVIPAPPTALIGTSDEDADDWDEPLVAAAAAADGEAS